jgi:hypothetical protein
VAGQPSPIMQHNLPLRPSDEAEDALLSEDRKSPRDRFKRQAKIIRNIAAVHRKNNDSGLPQAPVYLYQERCNFLERCSAAQQKKVVFNVFKGSSDEVSNVLCGRDVTLREPRKKAPALCDPDGGIDDCLGCKSMNFAILNPEDITG